MATKTASSGRFITTSSSRWLQATVGLALFVSVAWCCLSSPVAAQGGPGFGGSSPGGGSLFSPDSKPEVIAPGPSMTASDEMVASIRVEGAHHIPASRVLSQLKTRIGRPFDPHLVQKDVKKLHALPWFVKVDTYTEKVPEGRVVIFRVTERATIRYVEYLGNNKIKDKKLAKETSLKVGGALSPYAVEEGRARIAEVYAENGYNRVQVTVVEGTQPDDKGVVYAINEGKAQKIWSVQFEGSQFATRGQLKNKIKTKPGFARIFKGYLDYETIDADVNRLTDYYRRFGFFQAKVGRVIEWNDKETWATVRFVIHEGPQSQIRNVTFMGNALFASNDLAAGLKLPGGNYFERDKLTSDVEWLKELYGSRGYVFTEVRPDVRYLEEPGKIDLVYSIDEGKRFRIGRIFVHIAGENPHTKIQTALNRLSIKPGAVADIREIHASERRLQASSLFRSDPAQNVYPKISFRLPKIEDEYATASEQPVVRGQSPSPKRFNPIPVQQVRGTPGTYEVQRPVIDEPSGIHGLSGSDMANHEDIDIHLYVGDSGLPQQQAPQRQANEQQASKNRPMGRQVHVVRKWPTSPTSAPAANPARPVPNSAYAQLPVQRGNTYQAAHQPAPSLPVYRGQSPSPTHSSVGWSSGAQPRPSAQPIRPIATRSQGFGGQVVRATGPQSNLPSRPQVQQTQLIQNISPPGLPPVAGSFAPSQVITPYTATEAIAPGLQGLPSVQFTDPAVDVYVDLEETQTGRFLLGVGVNSSAGIVGQIMLDERNFNWRRFPSSWQDVVDGTAWRGGGQRLRIEAAPGSEVQRYLINFQEPFLMNTPVALGLGASYYSRRFNDWNEQRMGGRISLGYQWVQSDVSTSFAYRGENVNISNISNPAEPQLSGVVGDNALHGFRVAVVNDTRDSAFLATQGHRFELWGEGVIGTFDYPRGGIDLRKYFLVRERPDHSGRHVVSASTKMQWTGSNTPVYDQFFAGGFATMRGFDFRGASPVSNGVQVGGEFMWINSVEYMFPITADGMLHGVAFCDFGTVEPTIALDDFRVAPGFGLRITVPAMGPAPIALDFAWPVVRADTDELQVFSFNIGFMR